MDTNNDEEVILNTQEDTVDSTNTESDESSEQESVEELKKRLAKAEELRDNYKIRAEKAEKKKPTETQKESTSSSTEDIFALMKANISEEDISDVKEYAQFKGISIAEALKTSAVRSILAEKEEQRTVAQATNTGSSKRSSGKLSDDALIANAQKGNLPENDADIDRLVKLKMFGRK